MDNTKGAMNDRNSFRGMNSNITQPRRKQVVLYQPGQWSRMLRAVCRSTGPPDRVEWLRRIRTSSCLFLNIERTKSKISGLEAHAILL